MVGVLEKIYGADVLLLRVARVPRLTHKGVGGKNVGRILRIYWEIVEKLSKC